MPASHPTVHDPRIPSPTWGRHLAAAASPHQEGWRRPFYSQSNTGGKHLPLLPPWTAPPITATLANKHEAFQAACPQCRSTLNVPKWWWLPQDPNIRAASSHESSPPGPRPTGDQAGGTCAGLGIYTLTGAGTKGKTVWKTGRDCNRHACRRVTQSQSCSTYTTRETPHRPQPSEAGPWLAWGKLTSLPSVSRQ